MGRIPGPYRNMDKGAYRAGNPSIGDDMTWHGYLAIEDINLNQAQRQELWQVIQAKGSDNNSPYPQFRNHWRLSTDNRKGIFEALFRKDQLTIDWFKDGLGAIFGVDPATIDHATGSQTFDQRPTPIVVFSRSGTNYLRFAAFGGTNATWQQSRREVLAYLAANSAEWEGE